VVRGADLRFELSNPRYQALAGGRQLLGRTLREAFPEPEALGIVTQIEKAYRSGEPVVAEEMPFVSFPRAGDADVRSAIISGVMQPLRDFQGRVDGVVIFAHEVTELVAARSRVAAAEERLRLALDASDLGSWEYDPKSDFLSCDAT